MSPKEAVKWCVCGTFGGYLAGSHGGHAITFGLLGADIAQIGIAIFDLVGHIMMLCAIWWMFNTVAAIGRASQGGTRA